MNIAQLFYKLGVIAYVEIIVALLPEVFRGTDEAPRDSLLEGLESIRQRVPLRFAQQKMHMLRHDNVAVNLEFVITPHPLERSLEDSAGGVRGDQATAMVAAESDEMLWPL